MWRAVSREVTFGYLNEENALVQQRARALRVELEVAM